MVVPREGVARFRDGCRRAGFLSAGPAAPLPTIRKGVTATPPAGRTLKSDVRGGSILQGAVIVATSGRSSQLGYGILVAGVILAGLSAVVPYYSVGHRLLVGVLAAGLTPYLMYGVAVALLRRPLTVVVGLILLATHAWLVITERFIDDADYSDGMIYYVPLALALVLLPVAVKALRECSSG